MNLSVECESIDCIYTKARNVKMDLYNVDMSFIREIRSPELLKEIDLYELLDEVDFDDLNDYMEQRKDVK